MLGSVAADAQTVYKCGSGGTVVYSHEPCLGAATIDTTPTQGLDKSSGKSRKGADVRANEQNRAMADALRPILGETPQQREKRHRRSKLQPETRMECLALDPRLKTQEAALRGIGEAQKSRAETELLKTRARYRELRC